MLDDQELAAARRSVINAHYTDAALVQTIWDGVAMLGFTGGQVLEPGCGAGNFIAFAPETAAITGIELDPTTAAIAAALHPPARILAESFADTRIGTGSFALAIGNVPFGDVRLYDKRDNRGHHAIHNHCILKSLRAIRPGGLVAVITSAYTMDAANPAARREMRQLADLVGAVRLPSRVHARAAGTNALTDLLVFRRREEHRDPAPFGWEYSTTIDVDQVPVRVNTYFVEHPQRVLGRFAVGDGLYRRDEVSVTGDPAAAPTQLRQALVQLAAEAHQTNLTMTPGRSPSATAQPAALLPSSEGPPDNSLRANTDGTFSRFGAEQWQPYAPPKTQAGELRALLGLRDTAVALLQAEAASLDDTEDIDRLRAELNTRYDAYAAAHGPINRFTEVLRHRKDPETGRMVAAVDEETGQPLLRRNRPPQGRFRTDPFAPVVRALEHFDEAAQTATKPAIFTHRVIAPRPPRLGADTPADALAICVDDHGEVRLPTIAWLMGVDEDTARRQLGALVYDDPATGRLEPAAAYLSGDVKSKLATARAAADTDERYTANVTALAEAVPPDLNPEEITATGAVKMGAPWIGAAYVQRFLAEILDDPTVRVEYGGGAMWAVNSHRDHTVAATSTWGTDRRCAAEIAQTIVEQREFVITDTVGHGTTKRRVVNLDATVAATEKAAEMRERFADWIWEDDARSAALVAAYNDTFQRYVHRTYDDVQLSLPGLAMAFRPDAHQRAAVARIIHEPAVGLYHVVGAGKTATMVMGAMELRRLGLVHKPVVVVPNQLLDQWSRDFLTLYPQAKILTASTEDLAKERRRLVVAQMATGDWDAVILTEDAFAMLPMSPDGERAYVDRQLTQLDERIGVARANGAELTLKRLETMKLNRAAGLRERLDTDQDAGIWWELTGIDYLFRDESHRDKNLRTVSNVPGMSIRGSQRAQQMDLKLAWTRERHPRWGTRATGTPIANSIGELFTEYRYLRPDLMERQGITDIDSWLATYAEGAVIIEVTPDGGGLRNKTRLNFVNLEKLADSLHVFADVKTKDDLDLHRPLLAARADGQRLPEAVVVRPSAELLDKIAELLDKIAELVERAAKLRGKRPQKGRDNILAIVGEGSAAALDLRLVGLTTDAAQKLDVAADRIAARYHVTRDRRYLAHDGQPHPRPGALQMVFCDLGTPSAKDPGRWSAYAELRTKLVARGMPRETIRFVHDATDDRQRAELFAACRDGRVAVLVGSTEKMGTGVNVQDRLLSLHHLDCPWRPCDLQQREGRIDRRGNQNPEIFIDRYVTERSLDSFKYQKIAYKAGLADQVLTGKAGSRSEDVGEATLSYE
ncbi:MAG: helicase, partial [Dactylosporangium sp.]|nr:helicase [Dactylosporangium sp.]NNJ62252.1 helicase [Dactylosporangium sp.]